ncbi:hypothetical protein QYE76_020068 [Lolium multiflorum]|uniref:Uncharacterized protein n=1 Tax=Lolium multiflorum TaxID=4521 RepID=A0AAD8R562_LOLMU|nr:hypothetical protein QYE76_020068 [Lolium multiflorum]
MTANPLSAATAAKLPDGSARRARPTHDDDAHQGGGLLDGVDFRHRLRNIAKKLKANPRPGGALADGIDADGRLSPEIADLRRKAIEILKAGWRRMESMKTRKEKSKVSKIL